MNMTNLKKESKMNRENIAIDKFCRELEEIAKENKFVSKYINFQATLQQDEEGKEHIVYNIECHPMIKEDLIECLKKDMAEEDEFAEKENKEIEKIEE